MQKHVIEKLLSDYSKLSYKSKKTCVKYRYIYNGVNVNLYFDAFDSDSYTLTMILGAERKFYFTTLNVNNTHIRKEYLPKLPTIFLARILADNKLDEFYMYMENKILEITPIPISYTKDTIFVNTMKYRKKDVYLPFWWHMRKVHMSDEMLEILSEQADISREILLKIQEKGFTLVRTDDINKRRVLTLILKEMGEKIGEDILI